MIVTLSCGCSYSLSLSACPECVEDAGDTFRCATHGYHLHNKNNRTTGGSQPCIRYAI